MRYYAILNEVFICYGVIATAGAINGNVVEIDFENTSLIGKKYEDGFFVDVPNIEPPTEPSEDDVLEIIDAMLGGDSYE